MKKIKLTENQLHRVIKESVKKILNEIGKDTAQSAYDKLYRKGQYGDTDKRGNRYSERAEDLRDNYNDVYGDDLEDNMTPEDFFDEICSEVKRLNGIELDNGWYVEAETYGGNDLYIYESKEDADAGYECSFRISDNEEQHNDFVTSTDGSRSLVEELYLYGKNNNFDIDTTLSQFLSDMA